jgi:hypothetical protein
MKYQIADKTGSVYGLFPSFIAASLALKGLSTMLDDLVIKEIN